ncbi:PstC family ABC transporter permease [Entomohabitans teleogrylli]|uniref:PstC family ABC transporter permease n=1 Tax=Entomohabitans teleogrylli TaxID=1384589 RepID=UPI00073D5A56|nr:ABC transporter permease subunit [Entomohabitans teleogrylli]
MSQSRSGPGILLQLATGLTAGAIGLIFLMVLAFAWPVFFPSAAGADIGLFSWQWRPAAGLFGILPMIVGSVLLAISAVSIAWLLSLGISVWLLSAAGGATSRTRRWLQWLIAGLIRFMTSVPTVVYGFVAIFLLVPIVREAAGGSGLNWLSASLTLSLLLVPTMVLVMEAGLRPRMEQISLSASALGFSRAQSVTYFVLPQGKRCLLTALALGFGRGIGDTLIALMLSGNWPQIPYHAADSLRTLTAHMALVTANEVGGAAYNSLFAAGAILLLINVCVSLGLRMLNRRAEQ